MIPYKPPLQCTVYTPDRTKNFFEDPDDPIQYWHQFNFGAYEQMFWNNIEYQANRNLMEIPPLHKEVSRCKKKGFWYRLAKLFNYH